MTPQKKHGLYRMQTLSQPVLAEIQQLADVCNRFEGLDLKLNWGVLRSRPAHQTNDFLYYESGQLVGFLALYNFNSKEGEISGMVHPDWRRRGIFTTLFHAVREECQRRGVPELLFIVEHTARSGAAFVQHIGARLHHSEYKMVLHEAKMPPRWSEELEFRSARPEEAPILSRITTISFDLPEQDVDWYSADSLQDPERGYYVGLLNGVVIGKLDIFYSEERVLIVGFGVLPEYRGRGYGRQILARTLQELTARGEKRVELEVVTENQSALSLYKSVGFKETNSYDYYSYHVLPGKQA